MLTRTQSPSLRSPSDPQPTGRHMGGKARADLIEQQFRDRVVERAVLSRRRPHIRPRPDEPIQFRRDDPASLLVQSNLTLHPWRQLDSAAGVLGRAVRDRRDDQFGAAQPLDPRHDDDGGPILQPFLLSLRGLARPEIGIADDVSRLRNRP